MGILATESFQRFSLGDMSGGYSDPSWVIKTIPNMVIARRMVQANTTDGTASVCSETFEDSSIGGTYPRIDQDPVVAAKKRFSNGLRSYTASGWRWSGTTEFRYTFSQPVTHYRIGYLVRIASGSMRLANPSTVYNVMFASVFSRRSVPLLNTQTQVANDNIFGVSDASALGTISSTGASSLLFYSKNTIIPNLSLFPRDRDIFIEIEVDTVNQLLRVWIDDLLWAQPTWESTWSDLVNGFSLYFTSNEGINGAVDSSLYGNIYFSDFHLLDCTDGISPVNRLGATTRVLGEAPSSDFQVDFSRPSAFNSNAEVAAQLISSTTAPSNFLSANSAGQRDLYATLNSDITNVAAIVHGVTVKGRVANAAAANHSMAAIMSDGVNTVEGLEKAINPSDGVVSVAGAFSLAPDGSPWTPESAASSYFGLEVKS